MIIDADVHISPTLEGGNSITLEELLKRMEHAKVDKAITWLQPPYLRHLEKSNRYVYDAMTLYPDKIIGFGWADPNLGIDSALATVDQCVKEYGFYGMKMNGAQNSFYIDDPSLSLPVIERIASYGKPLALHVGADAYEHTHPFRVAKIAKIFPDLPILVIHMGGAAFHGLFDAAIEMAMEHPNMILVGSVARTQYILKAIRTLGAERVCFGSDTPFELMHVEVAKYQAMLQELPDTEIKNVMGGNICRILGLK